MSQNELATKAGISRSMLYQVENNKKSPTVETLVKLADALEIHPAIFFAEEDIHVFDMKKLTRIE